MNQLCTIAGATVGKQCINVEKFADGLYNKAFLMTMDDQQEVVAKVPNPNADIPRLTTASEVATMDFMRNTLNTPAPRVLAWNSSCMNPVRAEYIIMEKAQGVQLASVLPTMSAEQKGQVIRAIARYQREWLKVTFHKIGSLYYAKDLPTPDQTKTCYSDTLGNPVWQSEFALGPILDREWIDYGWGNIDGDRGPWTTALDYRRAVLQRDKEAIRRLEKLPTPLSMLCGPSLYQPTKEKKLSACEAALKALPRVLPNEPWASGFHLWHDDLHEENIYVDANDPTVITSIIDWQSTSITPLFDHAVVPGFLQYDALAAQGHDPPATPHLRDDLAPDEKSTALKQYEEQVLSSGYKHLLKNNIPLAFDALMFEGSSSSAVLNSARNLLEVGEAYCLGSIAALDDCPVQFSESELAELQRDAEKTEESINAMNVIKEALGPLFPERGIVRPDQYSDAKAALRRIQAQVVEQFSANADDRKRWQETWPFDS
ncbi:Hypothetical predicted protein [Lecanosticta acicola]|uniref:Aminoglycoside phosphotransferase domain-containing protein n=1 Tax=Lecanosticta acicola TaxID=111012 RepID=A0AAI9EBW5_9PEZI|nr:Hypothetical predicted protein [Lecanosticta acicola]